MHERRLKAHDVRHKVKEVIRIGGDPAPGTLRPVSSKSCSVPSKMIESL